MFACMCAPGEPMYCGAICMRQKLDRRCAVLQMCVLAGCDFVPSMPGMGVKKAHAGVKRFRTFVNVIKAARLNNTKVQRDYDVDVQIAYWTFRHQRCASATYRNSGCIVATWRWARIGCVSRPQGRLHLLCRTGAVYASGFAHTARQLCSRKLAFAYRVWCPISRTLVHLHDLPGGDIAQSRLHVPRAVPADAAHNFLGPIKPNDICADIAEGRVDPLTHRRFVVLSVAGVTHVVLEGEQYPPAPCMQAQAAPVPAMLGQASVGRLQRPWGGDAVAGVAACGAPRVTVPAQATQALATLSAELARTSAPATLAAYRPPLAGRRGDGAEAERDLASAQGHTHCGSQQGAASKSAGSLETDCSMQAQVNGQPRATHSYGAAAPVTKGMLDVRAASVGRIAHSHSADAPAAAALVQSKARSGIGSASASLPQADGIRASLHGMRPAPRPAAGSAPGGHFGGLRSRLASLINGKPSAEPGSTLRGAAPATGVHTCAQLPSDCAQGSAAAAQHAEQPTSPTQCSASEAPQARPSADTRVPLGQVLHNVTQAPADATQPARDRSALGMLSSCRTLSCSQSVDLGPSQASVDVVAGACRLPLAITEATQNDTARAGAAHVHSDAQSSACISSLDHPDL